MSMAEKLSYYLRNGNKLTSCVTVTIRYSDFDTRTRQKRIPYTSLDHTLIETVMNLFDQLYDRRVLVRLIGVRYSHLITGSYQMKLLKIPQKLSSSTRQWTRYEIDMDKMP